MIVITKFLGCVWAASLVFLLSPVGVRADDLMELPNHAKVNISATCPVCGMKVGGELSGGVTYAYRDGQLVGFAGVSAAVFKDGHTVGFEGARCLFIYNTIPKRFGIDVTNITNSYVTDFKSGRMIDTKGAHLVLGTGVNGPMGHDLIPFSSKEEAEKFKMEYKGKRIVDLSTIVHEDVKRKRPED
jgi:nitrous oxide reductase accessory protein NosL